MWQSVETLNVFNTLTLKHIFWKIKTFFKKLEYSFLVESTKIENASFPYKTTRSKVNVKTNRMLSTKWTYHKEQNWFDVPVTQMPIFVFFTRAEVLFDGSFSLWVSLKYEKGDRRDGEYNL